MKSPSILFHGQEFLPDPSGALYWPARQTLIASDLHLEKATYLASHGSLIAPYDTRDTLERLEAVIKKYSPNELILLGDSFHDRNAWMRLNSSLREQIASLIRLVKECHWIEGNHDAVLHGYPYRALAEHSCQGILFTHEPAAHTQPQVVGHFHPKTSISIRGKRLRERCFLQTQRFLVMPAFGSYTGGLDINHEAFTTMIEKAPTQVYMLQPGAVYKL